MESLQEKNHPTKSQKQNPSVNNNILGWLNSMTFSSKMLP